MTEKVRMVVYLSKEVHERLMDTVLERVNRERRFRGVLSEVFEECLRKYFGITKQED